MISNDMKNPIIRVAGDSRKVMNGSRIQGLPLLLMLQKSQTTSDFGCKKQTVKNGDFNYHFLNWLDGFLNHQ